MAGGTGTGFCPSSSLFSKPINLTFVYSAISMCIINTQQLSHFFLNRHCNRCGLWPDQQSLSILSRKVFTECRCQRHVKPQLGGPVIRTFQLPPPDVPHVWNDAREPQQRKVELWARYCREFCRKWRLPRNFWVLLHVVNLRHGTDGFTSPPKEGALRFIFRPKNPTASAGFETGNLVTEGQHAHL